MRQKQGSILKSTAQETAKLPERITQIDLLKGLAMISVILIHSWNPAMRLDLGAPFYLELAVPMFILIAGYTSAYAFIRYHADSLTTCYDRQLLVRRIRRILEPYTLMWIVQIVLIIVILQQNMGFFSLVSNYLSGGNGPGSFFIPVILQHILVVPLLFVLALRNARIMLLLAFMTNLGYFALIQVLNPPGYITSLLYVQFLFAGALGVYLAVSPRPTPPQITIAGLLGFCSIYLEKYTKILPTSPVFPLTGSVLDVLTYLWVFVLAVIGIALLPARNPGRGFHYLGIIGKASWHIFLVQMSVFFFFSGFIDQVLVPLIASTSFPLNILILFGHAAVMVILCCCAGCLWYSIEAVVKIPKKSRIKKTS